MPSAQTYRVLGLMSGTSLDGLDLAFVEFRLAKRWNFRVIDATTVGYPGKWSRRLAEAHTLSGESLLLLHGAYGRFLGEQCVDFIRSRKLKKVDAIASHGHTIFHQPENGLTFQLGDGTAIHAIAGLPVVSDFRSLDVHLGGEGAPLVPMGDRLLFASADVCLNLGGIANLSMEVKGKRKAFDLCFCNMALNHLARKAGVAFDRNGSMAGNGNVVPRLHEQLSMAYALVRRKRRSLGREFFERAIQPMLDNENLSLNDRMRTVCESVADEIEAAVPGDSGQLQMLTTGGGARNRFLIEVLRNRLAGKASVVLPSKEIIDFKEAIIFAFLGVLRLRNEINVLNSVTRAKADSCSGTLSGRWNVSE